VISLEQVRQLDIRVKKAVTAVKSLSTENSVLKQQVKELEARLDELSKEASERKTDEAELEVSLQSVLDVLDEVDGETSDMEPEPPADNYVIDTVPEPEEPEVVNSPDDIDITDEVAEFSVEENEPLQSDPAVNPLNIESTFSSDESDTGEVISEDPVVESEDEDDSPEKVSADPHTPPEIEPETINLDLEKDEEGVQSEFDIF